MIGRLKVRRLLTKFVKTSSAALFTHQYVFFSVRRLLRRMFLAGVMEVDVSAVLECLLRGLSSMAELCYRHSWLAER